MLELPMTSPEPLDPALAEFITSHVSLQLAATDDSGLATAVRCVGCRVSADLRRVTLLMPAPRPHRCWRALRQTGGWRWSSMSPRATGPCSSRGGTGASSRPHRGCGGPAALRGRFARRLAPLDVPDLLRTLVSCAPDDLVAVSFTPLDLRPDPGPRAGDARPGDHGE
jgi:hypothetical protein